MKNFSTTQQRIGWVLVSVQCSIETETISFVLFSKILTHSQVGKLIRYFDSGYRKRKLLGESSYKGRKRSYLRVKPPPAKICLVFPGNGPHAGVLRSAF